MSKKEEILDAALVEFSEKNYESASVNSIIKNANSSKGAFYHYFKNKEELYIALLRDGLKKKSEFSGDTRAEDIFSSIEERIMSNITFSKENPRYYQLSRKFTEERDTDIYRKAMKELSQSTEKGYRELFSEEQYEKSNISGEYPKEFVDKYVSLVMEHIIELFDDEETLSAIEEKLYLMLKVLKRGLKPEN